MPPVSPASGQPARPDYRDNALARYEGLGVTWCIVGLNAEKRDDILPVLDRWVGFMRGFKN